MGKDIDTVTSLKTLEAVTKMGLIVDSMNKLLIEKGIYTEEELSNLYEKLENEDEDVQAIKQAMEFLKFFS